MQDPFGNAFCARERGSVLREHYGAVVSGFSNCAPDDMGRARCSARSGDASAMDGNGKVQFFEE